MLRFKNLVSSKRESIQETQKTHYTNFKNFPVEAVDAFLDLRGCFHLSRQFFSLQKAPKFSCPLKICIAVYHGR